MDVLDVSRWQFGITTVYHFILVPLTIGLAPLVAIMQTMWVVTKKDHWYRLTKFFGKMFLINFALGVATGIVQEFQFGMNWSEYSRFVGDVFGAPLALEGLVAFFLESTFLGLWIFGWSRLPKLVHLATIWLVAIGVNASAYFIIVANSFMQHPVGATYNPETGRAELTSIWELLTNNTALAAYPHAVAGGFLTAATFVAGIGGWWMVRNMRRAKEIRSSAPEEAQQLENDARGLFRPVTRLGLVVMIIAGVALFVTGDVQAKLMFEQQPMKMASAESLCTTETDPNFSILTLGTHNNCDGVVHVLDMPYVLPYLAEGEFSGVTLQGVEDLQAQYEEQFGPGNYTPQPVRHLLVLPRDDRPRRRLRSTRTRGTVGHAAWTRTRPEVVRETLAHRDSHTVPGEQCGLDLHRDGASALGRAPEPDGSGHDPAHRRTGCLRPCPRDRPGVADRVHRRLCGALGVVWFWLIRKYAKEGPQPHDAHPPGDPTTTIRTTTTQSRSNCPSRTRRDL